MSARGCGVALCSDQRAHQVELLKPNTRASRGPGCQPLDRARTLLSSSCPLGSSSNSECGAIATPFAAPCTSSGATPATAVAGATNRLHTRKTQIEPGRPQMED